MNKELSGYRKEKIMDESNKSIASVAEELIEGDRIKFEGAEWTVTHVSDYGISMKDDDGQKKYIYNSPDTKWYDTLNEQGFEFISSEDDSQENNMLETSVFSEQSD